jgi:hypothetical protein
MRTLGPLLARITCIFAVELNLASTNFKQQAIFPITVTMASAVISRCSSIGRLQATAYSPSLKLGSKNKNSGWEAGAKLTDFASLIQAECSAGVMPRGHHVFKGAACTLGAFVFASDAGRCRRRLHRSTIW